MGRVSTQLKKSQALIMVEGDPNELGVREFTLRESGGFEAIEID